MTIRQNEETRNEKGNIINVAHCFIFEYRTVISIERV